jgi:hypothetical protein
MICGAIFAYCNIACMQIQDSLHCYGIASFFLRTSKVKEMQQDQKVKQMSFVKNSISF